jgi:hypothetical protein
MRVAMVGAGPTGLFRSLDAIEPEARELYRTLLATSRTRRPEPHRTRRGHPDRASGGDPTTASQAVAGGHTGERKEGE